MIALHTPNRLVDSRIGELNKGYNVLPDEQAQEWLKISNKVREATPQEIAAYYKV